MLRAPNNRPTRPWIIATVVVAAMSIIGSMSVRRMVEVTNESRFDVAVTAVETELRDRISGFGVISLILPLAMGPDNGAITQEAIESFMSGSGSIPAGAVASLMTAFPLDGLAGLGFADVEPDGTAVPSMLPNNADITGDVITSSPTFDTVLTAISTGRSATSPPFTRGDRGLYAHATPIGEGTAAVVFINAQRLVEGASDAAGTQVVRVRVDDVEAGVTVADTGRSEQDLQSVISSSLLRRRLALTITPGPDFGWQDPLVPSLATLLMGLLIAGLVYVVGAQTRRRIEHEQERARLAEAIVADKDRFIAAMSHELRTPLTSIMGMASMIAEAPEQFTGHEIAELSGIVAQESTDLSMLVEDLLVAARTEDGTLDVRCAPMDFTWSVVAAVRGLDLPLEVEAQSDQIWVHADPLRVRQILRNLIVNAVRHGGPNVALSVGCEGDRAYLDVVDDGVGISREVQARMFEPYYRSAVVIGQAPSVGLGLGVARDLAAAMGGSIEYEHRPGMTRFRLLLPSTAAPSAGSQAA